MVFITTFLVGAAAGAGAKWAYDKRSDDREVIDTPTTPFREKSAERLLSLRESAAVSSARAKSATIVGSVQSRVGESVTINNVRAKSATMVDSVQSRVGESVTINNMRAKSVTMVDSVQSRVSQMRGQSNETTEVVQPSPLEAIKGIGPVYASLLEQSGITTIEELAEQSVESLTQILSNAGHATAKVESWPQQAATLIEASTRA